MCCLGYLVRLYRIMKKTIVLQNGNDRTWRHDSFGYDCGSDDEQQYQGRYQMLKRACSGPLVVDDSANRAPQRIDILSLDRNNFETVALESFC